jgi:hypothetical protein
MTQDIFNSKVENGVPQLAEEEAIQTLRLVATLPPPEGLADRVHQRLTDAQTVDRRKPSRSNALLSIWRLWMPMQRLQFAGAALLVVAIGASSWTVYQGKVQPRQGSQSGAQPAAAPSPAGFGTAKTERRPATLTPIKVPPPATKKKPSANHLATPSPVSKTAAHKVATDDAPVQP